MRVLDPGHHYELRVLDGEATDANSRLTFVKREGNGYPFNVGHYAGTTSQEVMRALIDRAQYVDRQIHHPANDIVIANLSLCIWVLETRAAERHGRIPPTMLETTYGDVCDKCNHIGCKGECDA